jgi:NitT/TauT family transport system permease protein
MTVARQAAPAPSRWTSLTHPVTWLVREWGPPFLVFVALIAFWEWYTAGEGRRLIPPPTRIAQAAIDEQQLLWQVATATIFEALGGLAIGTVTGVAVAFAVARWVVVRDVLLPVAIGMSTIPLVAAAPILINWFGVLNPLSMMMMSALLVFFPIMVNTTRGLVEVPPASLELMRSLASTPWQILRMVRVPNMLPFFFTALKVASTLAYIGAIVGEYFGGNSRVLGKLVLASLNNGSFDLAWAAILIGASAAIITYVAVVLIERLVIPWHDVFRMAEP